MNNIVWKAWAPPKFKNTVGLPFKMGFGKSTAWRSGEGLIMVFALFASKQRKMANHLFVQCRFTRRIWELLHSPSSMV
jgi:hypothetical protein